MFCPWLEFELPQALREPKSWRAWQQRSAKEAACTQLLERPPADHDSLSYSGIFGYVNYLVEKDRKFIIDTLINGT
jgi:glucosamine--fructose-6-phosphate aminotransferase (isomerizing)